MSKLFTASEMHSALCEASGTDAASERPMLNRVRYLAKRGLLHGGEKIDDRGTLAFRTIEVFRCAILTELAGIAMDVRAFQPVLEAAERSFQMGRRAPPSMTGDGLVRSHGGLLDAINGVRANERWSLQIELRRSGVFTEEGMFAEFVWDEGESNAAATAHTEYLLSTPICTRVTIDLFPLFKPLIEIVGVPENAQ
ncbi:MAG: hypothetical protein KI785_03430 [Devosiaceae bacterium]|nr:hypothetical protein [Devosiaceae bacterium MH13]